MIHDVVRCRRCGTHPQHVDVVRTSNVGVQTVEFECLDCGCRYQWAYRESPTETAIPMNERPIPPARLRKLLYLRGQINARNTHSQG